MTITAMQTFHVQQAIFASSDRGSVKGYQLVGRSAGIDRSVAQTLCRWAPTQFPSDDTDDWIINYFPINDDLVAVTRTVLGGPEYSSRGGIQVVTLMLVLNNDQFQAYSCNPILVVKTALALGHMRLPMSLDCDQLPIVGLPSQPLVLPSRPSTHDAQSTGSECELETAILIELADMVGQAQKVALIGIKDPMAVIESLIQKLSLSVRRDFSFTTGLPPTVRRPFQVHFLPNADLVRQRTLDAQNIKRIQLTS